jgi:hypothetical protein
MNATLTASGIVCSKCSHWTNGQRVQVRHADLAAVRACYAETVVKITALPPVYPTTTRPWELQAPVVPAGTPDVPAGRYAVRNGAGEFEFFKIDKPTEGRWAGRTFVKRQAGDDLIDVRDRSRRVGILAAILAVGAREASIAYGRELGVCGVCGRTLTVPESIAAGIGPVCAGRF